MSRKCAISGKSLLRGNSVSHSNNRQRKVWNANLHQKRLFDSESGKWIRVKISTRVLRTIDKKGVGATLKDMGLTIADLQKA